jgi:hypothetical protein
VQVSAAIAAFEGTSAVAQRERSADAAGRAPPVDGALPRDRVTLSGEARARAENGQDGGAKDGKARTGTARKLTARQQREVLELQQSDTHVRQHEAAHQAAGGSLTGGATFSYQQGPDGRSYAVGGEVPVSLRVGRTPEETISNARQARRAALAPADPSPQDLAVAAQATQLELSAQVRKARQASEAYGKQSRKQAAGGAARSGDASTPELPDASGSDSAEPIEATRAAA